jgi:phosphoglycolate phosphatase
MKNIQLILFDFDGTLANTLPAVAAAMQQTFRNHGRTPPPDEAVSGVIGMPLVECFTTLDPELPGEEAKAWTDHYRSLYLKYESRIVLYDGAEKVLDALRQAKCALAAVSNKSEIALQANADRLGVSQRCSLLVGEKPGAPTKPDPRVITESVLPRFPGVAVDQILMVGDAEWDMALAQNAKTKSALAGWGYGDRAACMRYAPSAVLEDIRELPGLLGL